jgi:transposase
MILIGIFFSILIRFVCTALQQYSNGRAGIPVERERLRGGWNTEVHLVAANARTAITFALSPGNAYDAREGRTLLPKLGPIPEGLQMLMDRAYERDETRQLVLSLGMIPVVPPKSNRIEPWEYDRAFYKKHNEIERILRRLKGFAESSPASRNSMSSSSASSTSPSSSKRFVNVNTP